MENIGLVRRIDELGRIVIPKEIRKTLKVRAGDCLEIFLDKDRLVLIKQDLLERNLNSIDSILKIFYNILNVDILLTDIDKVVQIYTKTRINLLGTSISKNIYEMIIKRQAKIEENKNILDQEKVNYLFQPIVVNGDVIGSLIFIKKDSSISEKEKISAEIIKNLFINNLEI